MLKIRRFKLYNKKIWTRNWRNKKSYCKIIKPPKKIYPTKNLIKIDDSMEFDEYEIENYLETYISKLLKWVDIKI